MPKEQKSGWYPFDKQTLTGARQLQCGKPISIDMPISSSLWVGNGVTIFAGGGGKMKSGIQNGMVFAVVEPSKENSMILQPYANFFTGTRVVNGMVLHPEYPHQVLAALGDGTVGVFELEEARECGKSLRLSCLEIGAFKADWSSGYPSVNVLSFSPDGKVLVTGGADQKIRFFKYDFVDPNRVAPYRTLDPLKVPVECLTLTSSGRFLLASGYGKKKAVVIDLDDNVTPKHRMLETGEHTVRGSVAVGNLLVVFGIWKGKTFLMRLSAESGKLIWKRRVLSSTIVSWCLSPKRDRLIIGDNELYIQVHDIDNNLTQVGGMGIRDKDTEFLQCLAVTPGLTHVMSGFMEKKLNFHKLHQFKYKIFTCYNFIVLILIMLVVVCWGVSLGLIPPSIISSITETKFSHDEL